MIIETTQTNQLKDIAGLICPKSPTADTKISVDNNQSNMKKRGSVISVGSIKLSSLLHRNSGQDLREITISKLCNITPCES